MEDLPVIEVGLYKHFKGGIYEVTGVGRHSETLKPLVIYKHHGEDELWFRPYDMFTGFNKDGLKRFAKLF